MKIVSIDNGYYQTKVCADEQLYSIKSKYLLDSEGEFEYQGKRYSIGHGNYNINHDKTDNGLHRIITYQILSKLTEEKETFKLVLSLPMLRYKNYRNCFKEYMKDGGLITTRLNGERKLFIIEDAIVFMQGAGALFAYGAEEYKGKLIGLLDIGGLTAQGAIFEDLKPIEETMFCIDAGGIILNSKIRTTLNEKYNLNLQDYQIPYLTDYKTDIDLIIQEHFKQIIIEMQKKNWDIKTLPILATGGGSLFMQANRQLNNCTLSPDPIYDNARGLNMFGGVMFCDK